MPLSAEPLITVTDMDELGYDSVDPKILARVSAKVRRFTGQTISATESNAAGFSPLRLPQYPVRSITTVETEAGDELAAESWRLRGQILTGPISPGFNDFEINLSGRRNERLGWLKVTYQSGWEVLPDELVELICSIAARVASSAPAATAQLREKRVGDQSLVFSSESLSLDLSDREQQQLRAFFPRLAGPATIQTSPPW